MLCQFSFGCVQTQEVTAFNEIETETNRLHYGMEAVALLHLFSTSATNVALLPPSGKYWNCA